MWIADYREQTGTNCPYKGKATIWQYRGETGVCDGIAVPCDLNVCYKDYSALKDTKVDYKVLYEKERAERLKLVAGIEKLIKEYK